jgi:hypothetical protein
MKNFEELQAMIAGADTLAKSLSAAPVDGVPNKTIQAAAADGAAAGGVNGTTATDPNAEEEEEEGEGDNLTKSFSLTLDDGSVVEAVDATEMLKSFQVELAGEKAGRAAESEQFMKAFGSTIGIVNTLTSQLEANGKALAATNAALEEANRQIAELKSQGDTFSKSLADFGALPRGRRTATVAIVPPPAAAAAAAQPVVHTRAEILAKAMDALNNNVISGGDASRIEAALNAGKQPDQKLIDRIFK